MLGHSNGPHSPWLQDPTLVSSSPSSVPVSRLPTRILPTSDSRAAQVPALNPFASLNPVTVPGTRSLSPPCIPVCGLLYASAKISWHLHEEATHLFQAHVSVLSA